ncbi:MAG: hypothetical protein M5R36_02735 [Deltaproteobacteria bacterium]|nr:hypothetical protein [Deltaproteobacteria bacterium]
MIASTLLIAKSSVSSNESFPRPAHDGLKLVDGALRRAGIVRHDGDRKTPFAAEIFHEAADRDDHGAVEIHIEKIAALLQHAHHAQRLAAGRDALTDRIFATEKFFGDFPAHHDHVALALNVRGRQKTAHRGVDVAYLVVVLADPGHEHVVDFSAEEFDRAQRAVHRGGEAALRDPRADRLVFLEGQIAPFFREIPVVRHPSPFLNVKDVGADGGKLRSERDVEPFDHGNDGDDRGDADDDAERCEKASHFVGAQRRKRDAKVFPHGVDHVVPRRSSASIRPSRRRITR